MSKANQDPFYAVKEEVQIQLDRLRSKGDQFNEMYRNVDTSSSMEFKDLKKGLSKDVRKVEKELNGLKGAVEMIEKNRTKFAHVKDQELASRKQFVMDSQASINSVRQ